MNTMYDMVNTLDIRLRHYTFKEFSNIAYFEIKLSSKYLSDIREFLNFLSNLLAFKTECLSEAERHAQSAKVEFCAPFTLRSHNMILRSRSLKNP